MRSASRPKRIAYGAASSIRAAPYHLGVVVAVCAALVAAGCGGSKAAKSHAAAPSASAGLHDAIRAPRATELAPGRKVTIAARRLQSVGWQVSCVSRGRRVTAEAVPGQRTASGLLTGIRGGPTIWAMHNGDGSITIRCR